MELLIFNFALNKIPESFQETVSIFINPTLLENPHLRRATMANIPPKK